MKRGPLIGIGGGGGGPLQVDPFLPNKSLVKIENKITTLNLLNNKVCKLVKI